MRSSELPRTSVSKQTPGSAFVKSQAHLLKATTANPLPTAVPPPIAAVAGTLGDRHVLCLIGLPERGKPFIAKRLMNYLSFFHGAEVRLFDLDEYRSRAAGAEGSEEAAALLLKELKKFMESSSSEAAGNLLTASGSRHPQPQPDPGDEVAADALIDATDRRCKNVDSGKVAIIYSTDSYSAFSERWSGTSKERRRWAAEKLQSDKKLNAKLIFIEVIVTKDEILMQTLLAKQRAKKAAERLAADPPQSQAESEYDDEVLDYISPQRKREINHLVLQYKRRYVTLQEDGSEDDLSYIKLIDYGQQVVTNRMHGYLRMRIAQFLTVIHPTKHTIFLSRHGQSEYNVLGKIGGNPPLSDIGAEYARRLGDWVPRNVWVQGDRLKQCRLWTSSLQRTILTAAHIPHPYVPLSAFGLKPAKVFSGEAPLTIPAASARPPSLDGSAAAATISPVSAGYTSFEDSMGELDLSSASPPPSPTKGNPSALRETPMAVEPCWQQTSPRVYRNLDEIFAGEYEGMCYEDIKASAPNEANLRSMDKIGYRYPRGESYYDIIARLDPLVHEMESYHETLLLISHQAVLRLIYAYLMGVPRAESTKIEIPLHTIIKVTYDGWNPPFEERFEIGPQPMHDDGQTNL